MQSITDYVGGEGMKAIIGDTEYSTLSNISFSPEADITGNRTPINELNVDIITQDAIAVGQYISLYDDIDNLWAHYWITYAEKLNDDTVRVMSQSGLKLLERDMKDPVMYTAEPVVDVIVDIFETLGSTSYILDQSFQSETVTGFCPEQSAKTRLQWVCFAIGAYVKSAFSSVIEILPVPDTEALIPMEKTFWKPAVTYKDYVTAISITAFSFTAGTPSTTDEWVSDGTNHYIVGRQKFTLQNPDAPPSALVNIIHFDDIMLINSSNVSDMLTFFSAYYFKRMDVEMDVVNNAEYVPGDKVIVYTSEDSMAIGYVDSAAFRFGTQARSRLEITPVEEIETAYLTVTCEFIGDDETPYIILDEKRYLFPVGYQYRVENTYIDATIRNRRYVFRPTRDILSGTMASGGVEVTVRYAAALVLHDGILDVISVDEILVEDSVVEIS